MVDRGIKFAKDLKATLDAHGVEISLSSVSRLVYKKPKQIDMQLLAGLCHVLDCTPNDLLLTSSRSAR